MSSPKATMETNLDKVEIDEDGNLCIPSEDESIEESETAASLLDTSGENVLELDEGDDSLPTAEQRSIQKRNCSKNMYAGEGTPEEEREMDFNYDNGPARNIPHRFDEMDSNTEGASALNTRDLHDIELSVFSSSQQETATDGHEPTIHSAERGESEHVPKSRGLQRIFDMMRDFIRNASLPKSAVVAAVIVVIIGVILTIGLLPPSFIYVDYYELALTKNRLSGKVNREDVYYPGCYLLTPDVELISFQGTAHFVDVRLEISTSDKLSVDIDFSLQYFIKPEELGFLFTDYEHNYKEVVETMITSTIKNEAVKFNLDTFRLNRSLVEDDFRQAVAHRLSGDCCPSCCPRRCHAGVDCRFCKEAKQDCHKGIHMEMRHFQMGGVHIPDEISERLLRQTILLIEAEKEAYIQEHAVETKVSEKMKKDILNKAAEIREAAKAEAEKILAVANADYERKVQESYVEALKRLYLQLNVTEEDHKLSFMYVRALEDISDNMYNLDFYRLTSFN